MLTARKPATPWWWATPAIDRKSAASLAPRCPQNAGYAGIYREVDAGDGLEQRRASTHALEMQGHLPLAVLESFGDPG